MLERMNGQAPDYKYYPSSYYGGAFNYMWPVLDYICARCFERVIDIGCGDGFFGSYLKEKTGCFIVGLDANKEGLERARSRGYDETIFVEDISGKRLPFTDSNYDLALLKDVLEHLLDPMKALSECSRILKTDGRVLIHVPNHFPLYYRFKFLFTGKIDTQHYYPDSTEWEFPHIRFYTHSGLKSLINKSGLAVEKDLSDNFAFVMPLFSRLPFALRIAKALSRRFPESFCLGFTLICKKAPA